MTRRSGDARLVPLERAPCLGVQDVVDLRHHARDFVVGGVEVRRHADPGPGAIVDHDIAREERLRDLRAVRDVERDGTSTSRRITRGAQLVAAGIGECDELIAIFVSSARTADGR